MPCALQGRTAFRRTTYFFSHAMPVLWAFHSSLAQAQEVMLPEVTVSSPAPDSPTLPGIEAARERLATVPGGAAVVDAEQYREARVSTLPDALRFAPGVFAASRFGAEEARLSIRGSGLQRTFHGRGIELLQDGVPLNLADGSFDFQALEPLAARYVEVYRGANALQFGAATLGGAINFVSPSGLDAPFLSGRLEGGSFGYKRAQAATAGQGGMADWFLSGSEFFQHGYRDHARQDTQRLSGNLGLSLSEAVETRFFLNAVKSDSELPGALTRAEMQAHPRQADPAAVSGDQHRNFDLYRLSNLTTFQLDAQQRVELGSFYSVKSLFHPIYQVLEQDSDDWGINLRYLRDGELFGRRHQLVLGALVANGRLDDNRFVNVGGRAGARTAQAVQHSGNAVLFAEDQWYLQPATALVLGGQAVQSRRRLQDQFLSDGDNSVDRTYRRVSPKLGLRHELSPQVQLYGNLSGSYEPPTFSELAGGPNVTPVDAQRARSVEIGTRGQWRQDGGSLNWDVSAYRAQVRQELLSLNDASGNPLGTVNAGNTLHQGLELGLEALWRRAWSLRASYLLNDFRFDGDPVYGNRRLAGVPRQLLNAELIYKLENGLYLGPTLQLASASWVDHANTLQAPGYGIFGFRLGQRLSRHVSWFLDARNLGNRVYAATTNVVADARGLDTRAFYPGDGRAVYAGLELRY